MVVLVYSHSHSNIHSPGMSSTAPEQPDSVLLPILGESIMSEVIESCTSSLFYGEHVRSYFLEVANLDNFPHRYIHTALFTDNRDIPVSSLLRYS